MNQAIRINAPEDFGPQDMQEKPILVIRNTGVDKPNPRFHLVHYPSDWEWVDGYGLLPGLTKANEIAGANGCAPRHQLARVGPNNPVSPAAMLNGIANKGGIVIPYNDPRIVKYFGRRNGYYALGYETTLGKWYVMPWERPMQVAGGNIQWNTKESNIKDLEFRRFLRESGILPAPEPEVIQALANNWRRSAESRMSVHKGWQDDPAMKRRIERDLAKVEQVEAWLAEQSAVMPDPEEDEIAEEPPAPATQIQIGKRRKDTPNG